jgi:hypothetical protein
LGALISPAAFVFFSKEEFLLWLFLPAFMTAKALPGGLSRFPWAWHALRGRSAASAAGPLRVFLCFLLSQRLHYGWAGGKAGARVFARHPKGLALTPLSPSVVHCERVQEGSTESRGTGAGRVGRDNPVKPRAARKSRRKERRQGDKATPHTGAKRSAKPHGEGGERCVRRGCYRARHKR